MVATEKSKSFESTQDNEHVISGVKMTQEDLRVFTVLAVVGIVLGTAHIVLFSHMPAVCDEQSDGKVTDFTSTRVALAFVILLWSEVLLYSFVHLLFSILFVTARTEVEWRSAENIYVGSMLTLFWLIYILNIFGGFYLVVWVVEVTVEPGLCANPIWFPYVLAVIASALLLTFYGHAVNVVGLFIFVALPSVLLGGSYYICLEFGEQLASRLRPPVPEEPVVC